MNRYISKSYTTSKNIIDRQYTERGQLQCQLLLVLQLVSKLVGQQFIIYLAKVGGEKEKKAFLGFRLNVPVINLISDSEFTSFCVQGTRTQPLNCFGCSVHYRMSCTCAINKEVFSRLHSSSTHICLAKSLKSTHSTKLMKKLY